MRFIIHYTYPDGTDDSFGIEGDTIEDVRLKSREAIESRGLDWDNGGFWSEKQ